MPRGIFIETLEIIKGIEELDVKICSLSDNICRDYSMKVLVALMRREPLGMASRSQCNF